MKNYFIGAILFIVTTLTIASPKDKSMTFEILNSNQIHEMLPLIQKLRVKNYYLYPYLYISKGAEQEDISYYQDSSKPLIAVARNSKGIEALAIAIPFAEFNGRNNVFSAKKLFDKPLGKNINQYYYISELLFNDPNHPTSQYYETGKNLLSLIEKEINQDKSFNHIAMLVIDRPQDHTLYHADFIDETKILHDLGYHKTEHSGVVTWTTRVNVQKSEPQENPLRLWTKKMG